MSPERREKIKKENYAVVYTFLQDGQILLEKRLDPQKKYYGQNYLPIFGIKPQDNSYLRLETVVNSEYGCLPRTTFFIGEYTHEYVEVNYKRLCFLVVGTCGPVRLKNSPTGRRFWVPLDQAQSYCQHPHTQEFLQGIKLCLAGQNQEWIKRNTVVPDLQVQMISR